MHVLVDVMLFRKDVVDCTLTIAGQFGAFFLTTIIDDLESLGFMIVADFVSKCHDPKCFCYTTVQRHQ